MVESPQPASQSTEPVAALVAEAVQLVERRATQSTKSLSLPNELWWRCSSVNVFDMNPVTLLLFWGGMLAVGGGAVKEDDEEIQFRKAEDELYSMVCRHPTEFYTTVVDVLLCPHFYEGIAAAMEIEDLATDAPLLKVKKCSSISSYCPTLGESRCVSVPMTKKRKTVRIGLQNGTFTSLTYKEDSSCICAC